MPEKGTEALVDLYRHVPYYDKFVMILEQEEHPVFALELLKEELIHHILEEATFEPFDSAKSCVYSCLRWKLKTFVYYW